MKTLTGTKTVRLKGSKSINKETKRLIDKHAREIINEDNETAIRSLRRFIPQVIRTRILEGLPTNVGNLSGLRKTFSRVMSKVEQREIGDAHVGHGIRYTFSKRGIFRIAFYAENKPHTDFMDSQYGYNEYFAVMVAITGRKGYRKKSVEDIIAIPWKPAGETIMEKGKPIVSFPTKVRSWRPSPQNWLDIVTEQVAEEVVRFRKEN